MKRKEVMAYMGNGKAGFNNEKNTTSTTTSIAYNNNKNVITNINATR
jgi:hypothetical protein